MAIQTSWRKIVLNSLFSLFLFMTCVSAQVSAEDFSSHAYALYPTASTLDRISPLQRISLQNLTTQAAYSQAVNEALAATRSMPVGHKALLNLDLDFLQIAQSTSLYTDAQGKPLVVNTVDNSTLPDHGIWLDKAVTVVAARVAEFFRQYKAAGGTVDFVSLDYRGLALSANDIKAAGEASGNLANYLQAIQTDSRFASIQSSLGFNDLGTMYTGDAQALLRQQTWNAVMQARVANYLHQAFYTPLQTHFRSVQVSEREQAYYSNAFPTTIPGENTKASAMVGTGQNKQLTGILPSTGIVVNNKTYASTPFNALRYEVNRVRSSAIAANKPIYPTVFSKTQIPSTTGYSTLLANNDLYQEMLLHAALTGSRKYIYLNTQNASTDDALLNATLAEFDQQVGTTSAVTRLADNGTDWDHPYILTAALSGTSKVWRFTPELTANKTLNSTLLNSYPAQFALNNGLKLTIPNAKVQTLTKPISEQGYWLKEEVNSDIVKCVAPLANQTCTTYYASTDVTQQPALIAEQAAVFNDTGTLSPLFVKNWGYGGADISAKADGFSVVYQANLNLLGGTYNFTLKADDSAQVWIDNQLVLDGTTSTTINARTLSKEINLTPGLHNIRLQYTDISAAAAVDLSFKRLSCSTSTTKTCLTYIDKTGNTFITEMPLTQTSNSLNFDFNNFSFPSNVNTEKGLLMRWDGLIDIKQAGSYAFEIKHGLGALNIWIDGQLLYNANGYSANTLTQALQTLSVGTHQIRVELKAVTGSYLNINWLLALSNCSVIPQSSFCAEFFDNPSLTPPAKRFQASPTIDFDWASSAPMSGNNFPSDKFSVRWLGDFEFAAGNYTFTTTSDDGVRVWVDEKIVIDAWKDQWNVTNKQGLKLTAGKHRIKMEYYDNTGGGSC